MSNKRKLAQDRNWSKRRIMGILININQLTLTDKEKIEFHKINNLCSKILENWDSNSKILGLTPNPVYKIQCLGIPDLITKNKKEADLYKGDPQYLVTKIYI